MKFQRSLPDFQKPLLNPSDSNCLVIDEDIDVQAERERVFSCSSDNAVIILKNLCKVLNSHAFSRYLGSCTSVPFFVDVETRSTMEEEIKRIKLQ